MQVTMPSVIYCRECNVNIGIVTSGGPAIECLCDRCAVSEALLRFEIDPQDQLALQVINWFGNLNGIIQHKTHYWLANVRMNLRNIKYNRPLDDLHEMWKKDQNLV